MSTFWSIDIDRNKNEVSKYFFDRLDKCKRIKPDGRKQPVFEYLCEGWRSSCYTNSAYNIMGLKSTDRLVRGIINYKDRYHFAHGWVEFDFDDKVYIYDNNYMLPILKQDWEERHSPYVINTYLTQAQIFERLLEKHKDKIEVKLDGDRKEIITHNVYDNDDKDLIDTVYLNAKFVLQNGELIDFEAEEITTG